MNSKEQFTEVVCSIFYSVAGRQKFLSKPERGNKKSIKYTRGSYMWAINYLSLAEHF